MSFAPRASSACRDRSAERAAFEPDVCPGRYYKESREADMNKIAEIKSDDVAQPASGRSPYFSEEHELLRAQVRRFVETEIKPKALAWEEQGYVPREVLHRMGTLGFFCIGYPAQYGGAEWEALPTGGWAGKLGG